MFVDIEIKSKSKDGFEFQVPVPETTIVAYSLVEGTFMARITQVEEDGILAVE